VSKPPLGYRLHVAFRRVITRMWFGPRLGHLGAGSWIERPLLIVGHRNISIGDGCSIRGGARIEAHARFDHRVPRLTIGSSTNIEQNVHIMCQSRVSIGERVSITGNCAIVDVTHPIDIGGVKVGDAIVDEDSHVVIEDDVFVGFGAVVLPNVTIGRGAVIGANSVVTEDVPAWSVVAGAPARVVRGRRVGGSYDDSA
jgi:acetyltransferase-like isoleucine patch superfamily enzyme